MYHLVVNGIGYDVDVDGTTPLLWTLRDVIGLTGPKYGCGIERCGACTIYMDGGVSRSCITRTQQAAGHTIQTIEGLSPDSSDPVQQAWVAHQVPQCGFCQSGVVMAAANAVANGLSGDAAADEINNMCMCGTYQRMREALNDL
jgi:isoquinoline 1-oxidoreductase alpha subunit